GIQKDDFPTDGVVTHQLPLKNFKEGFELMKKGDQSLKVVLVP
ncbi:erythritol/L-threitol dehydrogenase, partial [Staphylococcus aureus]|nr:erythritol/L-threitol dehydrogenase [Staphylococcus aureus]